MRFCEHVFGFDGLLTDLSIAVLVMGEEELFLSIAVLELHWLARGSRLLFVSEMTRPNSDAIFWMVETLTDWRRFNSLSDLTTMKAEQS